MGKSIQRRNIFFIFLIFLLLSAIWFLYFFIGFPYKQFLVVVLTAFVYFIWGMIFHLIEGDFHYKIVIEYLLIAILAVVLFKGAMLR